MESPSLAPRFERRVRRLVSQGLGSSSERQRS
jgi:hypothetical protein